MRFKLQIPRQILAPEASKTKLANNPPAERIWRQEVTEKCYYRRQGCAKPSLPTRGHWVLETSNSCGQVGWPRIQLTTDVLLHPSEGDTSFFAAFTEP